MTAQSTLKDALALVAPDAITMELKSYLGRDWQINLVSDLVHDSLPSHIIGSKIFLAIDSTVKEKLLVKIGSYDELSREADVVEEVAKHIGAPSNDIVVPKSLGLIDLSQVRLSALLMSFHGLHTLEYFRQTDPSLIPYYLRQVLAHLGNRNMAWPAIMARNVVMADNFSNKNLCLVDWERGWYDYDQAFKSQEFFIRCIELFEEACTFSDCTFPYWSKDWPPLEELAKSQSPLLLTINIREYGDPRIRLFSERVMLPNSLSDGQFLRLIYVFTSLCECRATVSSPLFAADHISAQDGGLRIEVKALLLAWKFRQAGLNIYREEILTKIAEAGLRIHYIWRSEPNWSGRRITNVLTQLEDRLDFLGSRITNGDWENELAELS